VGGEERKKEEKQRPVDRQFVNESSFQQSQILELSGKDVGCGEGGEETRGGRA